MLMVAQTVYYHTMPLNNGTVCSSKAASLIPFLSKPHSENVGRSRPSFPPFVACSSRPLDPAGGSTSIKQGASLADTLHLLHGNAGALFIFILDFLEIDWVAMEQFHLLRPTASEVD